MALGLSEHGIRVNAIGPGSIATEMLASVNTDKAARHRLFSRTPLRRLGEPDEIARVAVFLASDACPATSPGRRSTWTAAASASTTRCRCRIERRASRRAPVRAGGARRGSSGP